MPQHSTELARSPARRAVWIFFFVCRQQDRLYEQVVSKCNVANFAKVGSDLDCCLLPRVQDRVLPLRHKCPVRVLGTSVRYFSTFIVLDSLPHPSPYLLLYSLAYLLSYSLRHLLPYLSFYFLILYYTRPLLIYLPVPSLVPLLISSRIRYISLSSYLSFLSTSISPSFTMTM